MSSQRKLFLGATLCLALLIATESYAQEEMTPRRINITVVNSQGDNNQCPSTEERERGLNEMNEQVRSLLSHYKAPGEPYECNGTPGWRRAVFINMTDTSYNCPPGLSLTSYSKRTCGRANSNRRGCSSTTFSIGGSEYSRVCGRIRGYQVGATNGFYGYVGFSQSIDGWYVDGVSLTHGAVGARHHIWSFAAGLTEVDNGVYTLNSCPCDTTNTTVVSPPFVGNDYFCESGFHTSWPGPSAHSVPFLDDPLWDGQNCTSTSTCCQFNNPPWFTKNLPNPTTDNIELRLCFDHGTISDSPLELIELYVQ